MKLIIYIPCIIALFSACSIQTTVVIDDIPVPEVKVGAYGLLNSVSGAIADAGVSKWDYQWPPDTSQALVEYVKLVDLDGNETHLSYDESLSYFTTDDSYLPETGKSYALHVKMEDHEAIVSDQQKLPSKPIILNASFQRIDTFDITVGEFSNWDLILTFENPAGMDQYGFDFLVLTDNTTGSEIQALRNPLSYRPIMPIQDMGDISGQQISKIRITGINEGDKLLLALFNLSSAILPYKASRINNASQSDFFADPEPLFSNFENGLGLFAAYNIETLTIIVQ